MLRFRCNRFGLKRICCIGNLIWLSGVGVVGMVFISSMMVVSVSLLVMLNSLFMLIQLQSKGVLISEIVKIRLIDELIIVIILVWCFLWVRLVVSVVIVVEIVLVFCNIWLMMIQFMFGVYVVIKLFSVKISRLMMIIGLCFQILEVML